MAANKTDIKLLFGVDDDASMAYNKSGGMIKKQLQNIVDTLNKTPFKIKFTADEKSLQSIRKKIQSMFGKSIKITVDNGSGRSGSGGSGGTGRKSSALDPEEQTISTDTTEYYRAMSKTASLYKTLTTLKERYAKQRLVSADDLASLDTYVGHVSELRDDLDTGTLTAADFNKRLAETRMNADMAAESLRDTGNALKTSVYEPSFGSQFGTALINQVGGLKDSLTTRLLGFAGIMRGVRVVKDMITQANELESEMAELQIVTRATDREYDEFGETVSKTAQEISTSISDLISATTTYSRLGYTMEEASTLAKYTGMLERVGAIGTKAAEESVTSILKAFSNEVDVSKAESVMDRLVVVGNNFPISVEQIATGMTNASSSLAAAGNSFNESVALLVAANTTIQDANKASTGLRTLTARLRNTKVELDELGEEMTTAKYEEIVKMLTKYQVSLTDLNGEYRSTYAIMKDIAGMWGELNSMERAAMATEIAGVRQQAVFYSLMDQFSEAENAMKAMENSAGELTDAYAIYQETTQAHLETLGAAWDRLTQDVVNSEMNKSLLDIATNFVNFLDKLARVKLLLPAILASVSAFKALGILPTMLKLTKTTGDMAAKMLASKVANDNYKRSVDAMTTTERQYLVVMLQKKLLAGEIKKSTYDEMIANYGLAASEKAVAEGANTVTLSFQAMALSNPIGMIMTAVGLVLSLATAFSALGGSSKRALDDIKSDIDSLNNSMNSTVTTFRQTKQSAEEIIPRFAELGAQVGAHGEQLALTDEEYAEFLSLSNQLAELFPSLNLGMDSHGNYVLDLALGYQNLAEQVNAAIEAERTQANISLSSGLNDAFGLAKEASGQRGKDIKQEEIAIRAYEHRIQTARQHIAELETQYAMMRTENGEQDPLTGQMLLTQIEMEKQRLRIQEEQLVIHERELSLAQRDASNGSEWNGVRQSASAWLQLQEEYLGASEAIQNIALDTLNQIDVSQFDSADELRLHIVENVIEPLLNMPDSVQAATQAMAKLNAAYRQGEASTGDVSSEMLKLDEALIDAGIDMDRIKQIKNTLGLDDITNKIATVTNGISDGGEAASDFVSSLSYADLDRVFNLIQTNGTMSIESLKNALETSVDTAESLQEELERVLDTTELFDRLGKIAKNIDKVTSAMKKLKDGTALTKSEILQIAEEFPEALKQSKLFTDGSIEGQKKLLEFVLAANEEKYDSAIKVQIGELSATLNKVQKQMEAEIAYFNAKLAMDMTLASVDEILNSSDPLASVTDLQQKISDFSRLTALQRLQDSKNALEAEIANLEALMGLSLEDLYPGSSSSSSSSGSSSSSSSSSSDSWFKRAYEEHKHWIAMDKETTGQFLKWLAGAYKDAYNQGVITQSEYYKYEEEVYKGVQDLAKDAKSALDDVLQYYIKTMKEQKTEQKNSLNERLNALKEFYDKQKQLLQEQYNEEKYLEEQGEKRKTVTALMAQLEQLQYDNSAYAEKRRLEIEEQLADAQKELADFEKSHALEVVQGELDNMYEKQAAEIKSEIEQIEDVINDPTTLYNQALTEIKNNTAGLYQAIMDYGRTNGNGSTNDAEKLWSAAVLALAQYKDYYGSNYNGVILRGYASGTSNATRGWHVIDEDGTETIFESVGGERFKMFTGGEKVLDAQSSDFLYQFARSKGAVLGDMRHISSGLGEQIINAGDIIINGDTNERTVSEIRRAQRQSLENLLREFSRLSR